MDGSQRSKEDASRHSIPLHVPQPQWDQFAVMRDYVYTHTQPQWLDVQSAESMEGKTEADQQRQERQQRQQQQWSASGSISLGSSVAGTAAHAVGWSPTIVRPPPFEGRRVCATCLQPKQACTCKTCHVCHATFLKNRHHCRRCWHAVCGGCWGRRHYVHMLGRPMIVCDRCSVPWAIANVARRDEAGLLWGLYAVRVASEMPRMCIAPNCRIFTRRLTCYVCGLPTVSTQPHVARVVRANGVANALLDTINVLDVQQLSLRAMEVDGMTAADVERVFRLCFHHFEEVFAFRTVTTTTAAQRVLLANVAAAVAYEYVGAPSITLALSDIPYAKLLQVVVSRERYTVLEAPGRVKFITFPGTHNWRTRWVDAQFSRVQETVWTRLNDGVRAGPDASSPTVSLCGGVRKTWSYQVHGGFAQEARETGLPLAELLEDVRQGGYTLILCGHSLGGAIAQYLSLQLLHEAAASLVPSDPLAEPRLMCVTFGAPLLGNYELADHVHACGWSRLFHSFVYRSDVVPRLSCTDELAWDAQSRLTHSVTSVLTAAQNWWRGRANASAVATRNEAVFDAATAADASSPVLAHRLSCLPSPAAGGVVQPAGPPLTGVPSTTTVAAAAGSSTNSFVAVSEAEEEARLGVVMDAAIRTSRDLLEEGAGAADGGDAERRRDADVATALSAFSSRCSRAVDASPETSHGKRFHNSRGGTDEDETDARVDGSAVTPEDDTLQHFAELLRPSSAAAGPAADALADVVIPARRMHRCFTCFGRYHFIQYGSYGYVSTDDSETAFGILKHGCGESTVLRDHSVAAYNRGLMIHLYRNVD